MEEEEHGGGADEEEREGAEWFRRGKEERRQKVEDVKSEIMRRKCRGRRNAMVWIREKETWILKQRRKGKKS